MILLDSHNRIIEECLNDAINHAQTFGSIKKGTDILFADFDDVLYHISAMKSKYGLQISIRIPFFSDLAKYNVTENLKEIYHDMVAAEAESGYSVSLIVDYRVLLQFDKKDLANYIRNVSRLKRNTFGVILNQMFIRRQDKLELNESQEMNVLQFRSGEKLYVQVLSDKVLVIFSTTFKDPEDAVIYKVFLQVRCVYFEFLKNAHPTS
ncbi:hypothetical protein GJ496_011753 [Pomphorhynchus laevis]|nr:hypothetical protein GJ496_011753 [Pomphorhynchus laevis]